MKKPSKRKASRKPSVYLVRYEVGTSLADSKPLYSFEVFSNKKHAIEYAQAYGGVLTRWTYAEQIEALPKRRGGKR